MRIQRRVPLAWKNLTHSLRRLLLSLLGVAFAVMLMFMELGFYFALLDSMVQVIRTFDADLVLIAPRRQTLAMPRRFDRHVLLQAAAHPQVEWAKPLYIELAAAPLQRVGHRSHPIRVLAFDTDQPPLDLPALDRYRDELRRPDTALIDDRSKPSAFPLPVETPERLRRIPTELDRRAVHLVGTFELGTDFVNEGNLVMNPRNFRRYFPRRAPGNDPLDRVDFGLIRVRDGVSPLAVREALQQQLGDEAIVLTRQGLIDREQRHWRTRTPVGFVFMLGVFLGFVVGIIICYQIIYTSLSDLQAEFATLKAIGYTNRYLVRQVLGQSFYLSLFGFLPGWLLSVGLFRLLSAQTGLPMMMTPGRVLFLYAATLLMCLCSGGLALRKVIALDPADLF